MRSMFQSITKKNTALNCSEKIFPYNVCHDSKKSCTFILNIFNLKNVFFHKIDSTLSKTEKWTNKCFSNMLINDFYKVYYQNTIQIFCFRPIQRETIKITFTHHLRFQIIFCQQNSIFKVNSFLKSRKSNVIKNIDIDIYVLFNQKYMLWPT